MCSRRCIKERSFARNIKAIQHDWIVISSQLFLAIVPTASIWSRGWSFHSKILPRRSDADERVKMSHISLQTECSPSRQTERPSSSSNKRSNSVIAFEKPSWMPVSLVLIALPSFLAAPNLSRVIRRGSASSSDWGGFPSSRDNDHRSRFVPFAFTMSSWRPYALIRHSRFILSRWSPSRFAILCHWCGLRFIFAGQPRKWSGWLTFLLWQREISLHAHWPMFLNDSRPRFRGRTWRWKDAWLAGILIHLPENSLRYSDQKPGTKPSFTMHEQILR
jgi:hypothetical protein